MIVKPFIMLITIAVAETEPIHLHILNSFPITATESTCNRELNAVIKYLKDKHQEVINGECVRFNEFKK